MSDCQIIFVPGKNPKPEPARHQQLLLRCLLQGVKNIDVDTAMQIEQQEMFSLCDWNYDFYHEYENIDDQVPSMEQLLIKPKASLADRLVARSYVNRFVRWVYIIGDKYPIFAKVFANEFMQTMLDSSTQYFENEDSVAEKIRSKLKIMLLEARQNNKRVLLIGHSMGSIIAYDSLVELMHECSERKMVDLLLTIGSPLGMDSVQPRLLSFDPYDANSFPDNIKHWKNVAAHGDRVSIDNSVADDFSAMLDHNLIDTIVDYNNKVFNWYKNDDGYDFHRSYGYLVNPVLSKIICDWWAEHE